MAIDKKQRLPYFVLLGLLLFAFPGFAQVTGPEPPNQSREAELKKSAGIQMNVEMALVNVTVTERNTGSTHGGGYSSSTAASGY